MNVNDFLSTHAVFTVKELDRFLARHRSDNPNTRNSLLSYYRNRSRIIPVRRGLYATVPPGQQASTFAVDPYLIAARMTPDAVLAYHTALEFHGKAYSVFSSLYYSSARQSVPLRFRTWEFRSVLFPRSLRIKGKEMFGVDQFQRSGVDGRVTNLERTLVDVLDRPDLAGSWEEIWRSLESIEFFDLDQLMEYVLLLENATTAAKVGFYLEQHQDSLMVEQSHLEPLRKRRPKQAHYLMRGRRRDCKWVKDWNLMVPEEILNRSWEDIL
jgi:predicted transcriptional regulator of viral defense system